MEAPFPRRSGRVPPPFPMPGRSRRCPYATPRAGRAVLPRRRKDRRAPGSAPLAFPRADRRAGWPPGAARPI